MECKLAGVSSLLEIPSFSLVFCMDVWQCPQSQTSHYLHVNAAQVLIKECSHDDAHVVELNLSLQSRICRHDSLVLYNC